MEFTATIHPDGSVVVTPPTGKPLRIGTNLDGIAPSLRFLRGLPCASEGPSEEPSPEDLERLITALRAIITSDGT